MVKISGKIINKIVSFMNFILLVAFFGLASTASAVPSITDISPNGGENWERGKAHTISWSFAGSPGANVKIELLKNGALNSVITSSTPNDRSYSWTTPATQTLGIDYKIKVTSTTNSAYRDTSSNNFIISAGTSHTVASQTVTSTKVASLTVASPNGGDNWARGTTKTITWTSSGSLGANVKIELLKNGAFNSVITSSTPNDGSYSWTIPATQTLGIDYKIKVTSTTNSAYRDTSSNNFIISARTSLTVASQTVTSTKVASLTVASPNGGDNWARGTTKTITWTSSGSLGANVKIELLKNGVFVGTITANTPNDGSYVWPISTTGSAGTGIDYKVRITSTTNPAYTDTSNNNFALTSAGSTVASPTVTSPPAGKTISINPDKTLSVNGKKTFPVYMYSICNAYYELKKLVKPCTPSDNSEFLFSSAEHYTNIVSMDYINKFEQSGVFYTTNAASINSIPQDLIDSSAFFGYYQLDEPTIDKLDSVRAAYNQVKLRDTKHPVILNHWKDMKTWAPYADIITWDAYPVLDDIGWNKGYFTRKDAIYAWEHYSWHNFLKGTQPNSLSKPVWTVIQANGLRISDGSGHILVPTPKEARVNTYTAITLDVKGIGFWNYVGWGGTLLSTPEYPLGTAGLYNKPELHAYYRQLARELVSFNDILVLPTKDYSWEYRKGTMVSFSKNLINTLLWRNRINFNYIMKQSGSIRYLIVVNKDSRPISDVKLTISGLTGSMSAKTLGLETSGSGRSGRVLSVNNGQFTDSFDGYGVHIYKVS